MKMLPNNIRECIIQLHIFIWFHRFLQCDQNDGDMRMAWSFFCQYKKTKKTLDIKPYKLQSPHKLVNSPVWRRNKRNENSRDNKIIQKKNEKDVNLLKREIFSCLKKNGVLLEWLVVRKQCAVHNATEPAYQLLTRH